MGVCGKPLTTQSVIDDVLPQARVQFEAWTRLKEFAKQLFQTLVYMTVLVC